MIVIDRKSGKTKYADPITPAQQDELWAAIVRHLGPSMLKELENSSRAQRMPEAQPPE
jgi:hypothetical protein